MIIFSKNVWTSTKIGRSHVGIHVLVPQWMNIQSRSRGFITSDVRARLADWAYGSTAQNGTLFSRLREYEIQWKTSSIVLFFLDCISFEINCGDMVQILGSIAKYVWLYISVLVLSKNGDLYMPERGDSAHFLTVYDVDLEPEVAISAISEGLMRVTSGSYCNI